MNRCRRTAAVALALASIPALALEPDGGRMLVASSDLRDPNFGRSVVLLLDYSEDGALGLIVNRPGRMQPADALPDIEGLEGYRGRLHFGGPVALRAMLLLVRGTEEDWDTEPVFDDVHVSADPAVLRQAPRLGDRRLRIFAGHAGWAPGQLDAEIARGSWQVIDARVDYVFADRPESLWNRLSPAQEPLQAGVVAR